MTWGLNYDITEQHYEPVSTFESFVCLAGQAMLFNAFLLGAGRSEEVYTFTAPETDALRLANRGRASAKLAPLPATRLLKINLDAAARISWSGRQGSHSAKSPHDRRGHWRTYKTTGKRVFVQETTIKGGSQGMPRPTKVVIKQANPGL